MQVNAAPGNRPGRSCRPTFCNRVSRSPQGRSARRHPSRSCPGVPPHLPCSRTRATHIPCRRISAPGLTAARQLLPEPIQKKMESFFNTSFADVRVHVGNEAPSIGALAFTHRTDLYFAPGQYNPQSNHGQQLLGHELTHVLQQRAGRVRNPLGAGVAVVQDPALEAEAERMGLRAATSAVPIQARRAGNDRNLGTTSSQAVGLLPRTVAANGPILPKRPLAQVSVQRKVGPILPGTYPAAGKKFHGTNSFATLVPGGLSARLGGLAAIQCMPTLRQFKEGMMKYTQQGQDIFARSFFESKALDAEDSDVRKITKTQKIVESYFEYERKPSMTNLAKLYDSITFWEALSNTRPDKNDPLWAAKDFLRGIKSQIVEEIQKETEKQFGTEKDIELQVKATKVRMEQHQKWESVMPAFLKKVGVAPLYYAKHLKDYPERVKCLKQMYRFLKKGDRFNAEAAYRNIANVPGVQWIKPLLIAQFAERAGLRGLIGTKSHAIGGLTEEERAAITLYSSQAYIPMNAQLRGTLSEPDAPMSLADFDAFIETSGELSSRETMMELVVARAE